MLFIDVHEPDDAKLAFSRFIDEVYVVSLNTDGKPDYFWRDIEGKTRGWERKQLGEALSDLDHVEEQLNEQLHVIDDMTLIVEGVGIPSRDGIQLFSLTDDKRFFRRSNFQLRSQPALAAKYTRFKASLRMAGVSVVETSHWSMTVHEIGAYYVESNKKERTTLRRYVNPHIPPFSANPHVNNLMRLKNNGLGALRAEGLIKNFHSFYNVVTADFDDIADVVGPGIATKFFKSIGRDV